MKMKDLLGIPLNPYQGLKPLFLTREDASKNLGIPLNPYQGLKLVEPIVISLNLWAWNSLKSLSGIETYSWIGKDIGLDNWTWNSLKSLSGIETFSVS